MKKGPLIIGLIVLVAAGIAVFLGSRTQSSPAKFTTHDKSLPSQSAPLTASGSSLSQDPQDIVPGLYKNPILNNSTKEGFAISSVMVENNTDAAGNAVSDNLELTLKNLTGKDLSGFEVYYTITDSVTNKKEGYYKRLDGFVLKANSTDKIHFDNKVGYGHFSANTNSIYKKSNNQLRFDVMVSTPGYKVAAIQATKAAGGAEVKD